MTQKMNVYYNRRFPDDYQTNFETERQFIWSWLQKYLENGFTRHQFTEFINQCDRVTNHLQNVYYLEKAQVQLLVRIYISMLFDRSLLLKDRQLVMSNLIPLLKHYKGYLKGFKVDWEPFYEEITNYYLRDMKGYVGQNVRWEYFRRFYQVLKLISRYFEPDCQQKLFQRLRKLMSTHDVLHFTTVQLVWAIMTVHKGRLTRPYYEEFLEEFFGYFQYFQCENQVYLNLWMVEQMTKHYPDIIWSKYYKIILPEIQKKLTSRLQLHDEIEGIVAFQDSNQDYNYYLNSMLEDQTCGSVGTIMANLIRTEDIEGSEEIWDFLSKINNLFRSFTHPENDVTGVNAVVNFYRSFSHTYIHRASKMEFMENRRQKGKGEGSMDIEGEQEEEDKFNEYLEEHSDIDDSSESSDAPDTSDANDQKTLQEEAQEKKRLEEKAFYLKQNSLNEKTHKRFYSFLKQGLEYLMFLSDDIVYVANIVKRLLQFRPQYIQEDFLNHCKYGFEKIYIYDGQMIGNYSTVMDAMLNRKRNKHGIYKVPDMLQASYERATSNDIKMCQKTINLYEKLCNHVPIYTVDDLVKLYQSEFKGMTKDDVAKIVNEGEDYDMMKWTEQVSDLCQDFFKKSIDLVHYLNNTGDMSNHHIPTLFIHIKIGIFMLIINSSDSIFKQQLETFYQYLEDNPHQKSTDVQDMIEGFMLRNPSKTFKMFFPLLSKRIIQKGKTKLEKYESHSYFHILKNHPYKEDILKFKIKYANKKTLKWHLTLMQDLLSFSRANISKYLKEIHAIITYALLHKEKEINEKGAHLIKIILHSLIDTYPEDIKCYQPKIKDAEGNPLPFYKSIGVFKNKDFEMTWHQNDEQERKLAVDFLNVYFYPTLQDINDTIKEHLPELYEQKEWTSDWAAQQISSNMKDFMNVMNFKEREFQKDLSKKIDMDMQLLAGLFAAIQIEAPLMSEQNVIDKTYNEKYAISEFKGVRKDLLVTVSKIIIFLFKSTLIKDPSLAGRILNLISPFFGLDSFNDKLLDFKKTLQRNIKYTKNEVEKKKYICRKYKFYKCCFELNKRIVYYHTSREHEKDLQFLKDFLFLFMFYPQQGIANLSYYYMNELIEKMPQQEALTFVGTRTEFLLKFNDEKLVEIKQARKDMLSLLEEEKQMKAQLEREAKQARKDPELEQLVKMRPTLQRQYSVTVQDKKQINNKMVIQQMNEFQKTLFTSFKSWTGTILGNPYTKKDAGIFKTWLSFFERDWTLVNNENIEDFYDILFDFVQKVQTPYETLTQFENFAHPEKYVKGINKDYHNFCKKQQEVQEEALNKDSSKLQTFRHEIPYEDIRGVLESFMGRLDPHKVSFKRTQLVLSMMVIYLPRILEHVDDFNTCLEWVSKLNLNKNFYVNFGARQVLHHFLEKKAERWVVVKEKHERTAEEFFKSNQGMSVDELFKNRFKHKQDIRNKSYYLNSHEVGQFQPEYEFEVEKIVKDTEWFEDSFLKLLRDQKYLTQYLTNLEHQLSVEFDKDFDDQPQASDWLNKAIWWQLFQTRNSFKCSDVEENEYLKDKVMGHFSQIAQTYGEEVFTLFEPVMDSFDHKLDDIFQGNKYLLPHMVCGLINGSFNWSREVREQLFVKCLPYYQKGWETNDPKLYQMWSSAWNYIIKMRDINMYSSLLDTVLQNPFEGKMTPIQKRRLIQRYMMIQYFGKEQCDDYGRLKVLQGVGKNIPADQQEMTGLVVNLVLPCVQNSSLVPVFYPAVKRLNIKGLDELIQSNPDEYQLFSSTLLMRNHKPLQEILKQICEQVDTLDKESQEWDLMIRYICKLLATSSFCPRMNRIYFNLYTPLRQKLFALQDDCKYMKDDVHNSVKALLRTLAKYSYDEDIVADIIGEYAENFKNENQLVVEQQISNYQILIMNNSSKTDLFQRIFNLQLLCLHEQSNVRTQTTLSVKALMRICTDKELLEFIYLFTLLAEPKAPITQTFLRRVNKPDISNEDITGSQNVHKAMNSSFITKELKDEEKTAVGVSGLISILLSLSHDTEEWMNGVLKIILKNKKLNDIMKESVKDFITQFGKTHMSSSNFSNVEIDEDIIDLMKSYRKKMTYFA